MSFSLKVGKIGGAENHRVIGQAGEVNHTLFATHIITPDSFIAGMARSAGI